MTSIRKFANAPLVFVTSGVRFESLEALPTWMTTIQDELRRWLPVFRRLRQSASASGLEIAIDPQDFDPAHPGSAWVFSTSDHKTVVTLSKSGLLLHTTDYSVFPAFAELLRRAVAVLWKAADGVVNVNQIGIRYIDHIQAQHGMDVEKFVVDGLMPAQVSSQMTVMNSSSFASYRANESGTMLNVRFNLGAGGGVVPPDLLPLYTLNAMPVQQQDGTYPFPVLGAKEGSLDLDSVNPALNGAVMDVEHVIQEVDRLHRVANNYFYSVTTGEAREAWSRSEHAN